MFYLGIGGIVVLSMVLLTGFFGPIVALLVLLVAAGLVWTVRLSLPGLRLARMKRRAAWLTAQARETYTEDTFTTWAAWPVEPATRAQVEAYRSTHQQADEMILGRLDADGRILGRFGVLPWLDHVPEAAFVARHRFGLDVVLREGRVLIKKDFRGDRQRFVREWYNLVFLYGKANVPAVYTADEACCVLYKNLIPGPTIRSVLVAAGARILNVQTDDDPELAVLDGAARIEAVWARGRQKLASCFSESFLRTLEQEMDRIHACSVARLSLTFGNVIVDARAETPWLIDLEGAWAYPSTQHPAFVYRREQDREKFSQIYGHHLATGRHTDVASEVEMAR